MKYCKSTKNPTIKALLSPKKGPYLSVKLKDKLFFTFLLIAAKTKVIEPAISSYTEHVQHIHMWSIISTDRYLEAYAKGIVSRYKRQLPQITTILRPFIQRIVN